MKRRNIRIVLLILIASIAFTGYLKGCNSNVYPRQLPISKHNGDTLINDSTLTVAAGEQYKKTKFHNSFFGTHYRDLWALPVSMKVFDIGKDKGGFKVLKQGGNKQTISLRLVSKDGKEYVLRSIDKDQSNALPPLFKNKILVYIIRDETSALNPYGAFIIPKLAKAINLLHTNPELVYIPYDTRFDQYADLFKERVAMLEEYPDKTWNKQPEFENAEKIINSEEMFASIYKSSDAVIDKREFLRARFLDILINDWDRHVDQWKWASFVEDKKTIYKPIPRDRDASFYKFNSGLFPFLTLIFNNKFQSFENNYKNIEALTKNGRNIDKMIINNFSEGEFINIAKEVQKKITDSIIEDAVRSLPIEAFELTGNSTINTLKARRDNLNKVAKEYYKILFKEVKVVGTDEEEHFFIERTDNNNTTITVKANNEIIYSHVFNHNTTKEISIYGLDSEDEFTITGKVDDGIIIKIYGGNGYDKVKDESEVKGYRKKTKVYDSIDNNDIQLGKEAEDCRSHDPEILYYDRVGLNK